MQKGGLIIRLIDVAMIILFGFIAISDIKVRAQIKLPAEQKEENQREEPEEPMLLFVKIESESGFFIEENGQVIYRTQDLSGLEQLLVRRVSQAQSSDRELVVLIEPDENSMIQHTVDVLDICERNNIPKNINYESLQF